MSESEFGGASNEERLLAAARSDNEELLLEVFEQEGTFDVNCQDGLGNTPLHNAVLHASTDVLEHILSHPSCDVDPLNRLDRATPLHLAVARLEDKDLRKHVVESLLDAGADTTIRDRNGDTALDLVPADDTEVIALIRKARAGNAVARGDIAEDDDDDDEAGSGSGSDSE
ncbi:ankyrin [Coprinellus micaceus]|uniref:Ankyrin n=1 Tax=Coprinellus micaceus TaxID=71717 RepID=A0A4Y7TEH5_COPMI|nr:ankyrin [Coprinellus micaceus]